VLAEQELEQEVTSGVLDFLWLEITGKCNLRCIHCYAESEPSCSHGVLEPQDWKQIVLEAKKLGCKTVQFIGGEPTVHPHFVELVRYAHQLDLEIEVFTNLLSIPTRTWTLFEECNVSVATSFYSAVPDIHDQITELKGSHGKTLANIAKVLEKGFPLRVGLIKVLPEQDVDAAEALLRSIGVTNVGIDHVRSVGRGASLAEPVKYPEDALCGDCAFGKAAVVPDGSVYPCVFSRWLPIGNVLEYNFTDIVIGHQMQFTRGQLALSFLQRQSSIYQCEPQACNPMCTPRGGCQPNCAPRCSPTCNPIACNPRGCWPATG